jgi:hypothetical protein
VELAVVERGLLGAGGREHDGVLGRHARRVARGQPQPAPRLSQRRRRLLRRARVHRRRLPRGRRHGDRGRGHQRALRLLHGAAAEEAGQLIRRRDEEQTAEFAVKTA